MSKYMNEIETNNFFMGMAQKEDERRKNEQAVQNLDSAADLIQRAYQMTSDEAFKAKLRQQWNAMCELLKEQGQ